MHHVRTFDRFARLYDAAMWAPDPTPVERGFEAARRDVERVLDVGGGSGRVARALDRDVTVVDAAPGMVRRAHGAGVPALLGDATRLPVRDGAVDAVIIVDALHHFPDAAATIEAARRALAPGGVLVVREFDPTTVRGRAVAIGERLAFGSTFYTPERLHSLLAAADLEASLPERGFTYTAVGVRPEPGDQ